MKQSIITYLILLLATSACIDVIDLDLESSQSCVVVEGYIEQGNFARVFLTESAAYDDVVNYDALAANVTISDSQGNSELLSLSDDKTFYVGRTLVGKEDETYTLDIMVDTVKYSAESYLPAAVAFDSVTCEYNVQLSEFMQLGAGGQAEEGEEVYDSLYNISLYYSDIAGQDNYYLARLAHGDMLLEGYSLSSDKNEDGEQQQSIFIEGYHLSDTATIYLYSIDKESYNYYQGLSDLGNSDIPYNPTSNIVSNCDVLGFFSAQYLTITSFIIEDRAIFPPSEE